MSSQTKPKDQEQIIVTSEVGFGVDTNGTAQSFHID